MQSLHARPQDHKLQVVLEPTSPFTDNHVLECAIDGRADCIITGDLHLLELGSFQGVKIVTVADFLK